MVLSLIISPSLVPEVKHHPRISESWYVINNPKDCQYVLPVGLIKYQTTIPEQLVCPKSNMKQLNPNKKISVQYDDGGVMKDYDSSNTTLIINNFKKKLYVFDITCQNGSSYRIDLNKMVQTNNSSGYSRKIVMINV